MRIHVISLEPNLPMLIKCMSNITSMYNVDFIKFFATNFNVVHIIHCDR